MEGLGVFFIFYIYFLHTSQFCITEQGTNGAHTTLSKSDTDGSMKKNGQKKALDRKSDLSSRHDVSELQPETSASKVQDRGPERCGVKYCEEGED